MPKGKYIKNLTISEPVNDLFIVSSKSLNISKTNKEYLNLKLSDKTGDIEAKKWETSESEAESIVEGKVYLVKGIVTEFNQAPQIRVDKITRSGETINPADFMKSSPRDADEMENELKELVSSVSAPEPKALLEHFFSDPVFMKKFRYAPAAISMHHGYISGLLEHTLQVARAGLALAEVYNANRDVVLCGCLLHDIAKVTEYSWDSTIEFTTEGHLLGHLFQGALMVKEACGALGLSRGFTIHMEHMVLSHHGKYEWGSPKRPKSAEAMILFIADFSSANLTQIAEAVSDADSRNEKGEFTRKAKSLDRRIYRGDPLGSQETQAGLETEEEKPQFDEGDRQALFMEFLGDDQ